MGVCKLLLQAYKIHTEFLLRCAQAFDVASSGSELASRSTLRETLLEVLHDESYVGNIIAIQKLAVHSEKTFSLFWGKALQK